MAYDQKCYDLAAIFLGDEPKIHTEGRIQMLAQEIQDVIQDFMSYELDAEKNGRPVPHHGSGP